MKNPPKTVKAIANVAKQLGFCPCGLPATGTVIVQYNWFRGDDEQERRCDIHKKDAFVEPATKPTTGETSPVDSPEGLRPPSK